MPEPQSKYNTTPEFDAALLDAGRLLEHAASMGLWSETAAAAQATAVLIEDVIQAQEAARSERLTPQMVTKFWIAYGNLARLTRPVTGASLAACKQISLAGMQVRTTILVFAIICFSIFLFMSNSTLNETSDLIDEQNAAALKLRSDVEMLRTSVEAARVEGAPSAAQQATAIIAARVFDAMVEFSRRSTWLLQSSSRLNFWFTPPWMQLGYEKVTFNADNPIGIFHLNVPPELSDVGAIEREAVDQIKAYQEIRDYALGLFKIDTLIYSSLSLYVLPTVYALLGAFLYGFRFYARLIRRREFLPSAANSARYFIAAIAGLVIGLFATLLPKTFSLPPLAIAFLVGYGVEAFFSRLDEVIRRLKGMEVAAVSPLKPKMADGAD